MMIIYKIRCRIISIILGTLLLIGANVLAAEVIYYNVGAYLNEQQFPVVLSAGGHTADLFYNDAANGSIHHLGHFYDPGLGFILAAEDSALLPGKPPNIYYDSYRVIHFNLEKESMDIYKGTNRFLLDIESNTLLQLKIDEGGLLKRIYLDTGEVEPIGYIEVPNAYSYNKSYPYQGDLLVNVELKIDEYFHYQVHRVDYSDPENITSSYVRDGWMPNFLDTYDPETGIGSTGGSSNFAFYNTLTDELVSPIYPIGFRWVSVTHDADAGEYSFFDKIKVPVEDPPGSGQWYSDLYVPN